MNKMAKFFSTTLVISLLAASFVGCSKGSSVDPNETVSSKETKAKSVSLRFAWWGSDSRHKATLEAIELYKEKYPNVTIEAEYGGFDGYEQKIKTQLAGGSAPDIMQLDQPWLPELAKGTLLLDLNNQQSLDIKGFNDNFLKDFSIFNNMLVGLPTGTNARIMIFNKTLADKMGVPTDLTWTWDNLLEEGKKLHDQDEKMFLLNSDTGLISNMLRSILRQKSNSPLIKDDYSLSFSKGDATDALDWIQKAYQVGVFQPLGESQLFSGKTDQNPKWINQEVVGAEAWSSEISKFKGTLPKDVTTKTVLPALDKGSKTGAALIRPSQVISINGKSENPEEAIKFVNWFLNDKEAALVLGDVRAVPAVDSSKKAIVDANKLDKDVSLAVDLGTQSQAIPDNAISNNTELGAILNDVIQGIAFGKQTPEQGADDLIKRFTVKVNELKELKK